MTDAPVILTKEFCENNRICFYPETEREAIFIQQQLLKMGFKWCNGSEEVEHVSELPKATLNLNYGADFLGISWTDERTVNGLLCTADQFEASMSPPESRRKTEIITPVFCADNILIFYPASVEESAYIQKKLFSLGNAWSGDETRKNLVFKDPKCCETGIAVVDGKIYLDPSDEDIRNGVICRAEQLGDDAPRRQLTPEELSRQAMFNELSARLKQQGAQIQELHNEVVPKPIEKKVALPATPQHH